MYHLRHEKGNVLKEEKINISSVTSNPSLSTAEDKKKKLGHDLTFESESESAGHDSLFFL